MVRGSRRARVKKPSAQQLLAPIKIEKAYMTAETITVKDPVSYTHLDVYKRQVRRNQP